jgi:hypothetical protein
MIIGIDFDGTCVSHEFPLIGMDIGAIPVLNELIENGHSLILWTMRSNTKRGNYLDDAINWFKENNIPLYGIQTNPTQLTWTTSPKAYCHLYIDDAALGCPLILPKTPLGRGYVDWKKVREMLVEGGIIK